MDAGSHTCCPNKRKCVRFKLFCLLPCWTCVMPCFRTCFAHFPHVRDGSSSPVRLLCTTEAACLQGSALVCTSLCGTVVCDVCCVDVASSLRQAAMRRAVVAVSGGVDSSVAALMAKRNGWKVTAVHMTNWDASDELGQAACPQDADRQSAEDVCAHLGIPLLTHGFVQQYWVDVFQPFLDAYADVRRTARSCGGVQSRSSRSFLPSILPVFPPVRPSFCRASLPTPTCRATGTSSSGRCGGSRWRNWGRTCL